MDRYEIESLRRSVAMLNTDAAGALTKQQAVAVLSEVTKLQAKLDQLRDGLARLVEETGR